ncbi:MAG: hypothetical protein ACK5GN_12075 [Pseudomonadota bacterium]|jgi:hypothetical protein
MRKKLLLLSLCAAYLLLAAYPGAVAEPVRTGMSALLTPFRAIQQYIASEEKFIDPKNQTVVSETIQELRTNFHRIENLPSHYHRLPGFDENIRAVTDLLDDSSRRFSEGKTSYAWWRLRKLPSDCFTCHATYKVDNRYSNAGVIDQSLDTLNRARFLLATRQFNEAQEAFLAVLRDHEYRSDSNEALRSLVLISTRINRNPADGAAQLRKIVKESSLPEEDVREALEWSRELDAWSKESSQLKTSSVQRAEQLISLGSKITPDSPQNDVALLRGTAMLHQLLEEGKISSELRPRALYLLGFAYTKLPLFFSESWAEMYLERCISETPGTAIAQKAYRTYRDHIVDDYTGTAGTEIPAEVKLHLDDLRHKAFGVGTFSPLARKSTS